MNNKWTLDIWNDFAPKKNGFSDKVYNINQDFPFRLKLLRWRARNISHVAEFSKMI